MNKIYRPSTGPEDWRQLLADPEKQWKDGYSAKCLAKAWHAADGFPPGVLKALNESSSPALQNPELLLAIPEYKVPLPGGSAASQNDLFVLARSKILNPESGILNSAEGGLFVVMVEGKVNESFGPLVSEWLTNASIGKKKRLAFICEALRLDLDRVTALRYQLLHRAASALITAQAFGARHALMLVHSFSSENQWFDDFRAFTALFGVEAEIGQVHSLSKPKGLSFQACWVKSDIP